MPKQKKLISMKEATDRMWSENAKCRAGYTCAFSGATSGLNTHHLLGKATLALRYSHANAIVISSALHKFRFHNASYAHESLMKGILHNETTLEHLESLKWTCGDISLETYYEVERDEFLEHLRAGSVRMTRRIDEVLHFIEVRNGLPTKKMQSRKKKAAII